jgi:lipoyl(octanoyl) transferase
LSHHGQVDKMHRLAVWQLGRVEYDDGLRLQKLFGEARAKELVPDSLLLLEHAPVLTLGRGGKRKNIVASAAELAGEGVEVFETDRGGDVTYHGPGQVVGYPIFRLPPERHDVRRYIRDLEESIIRVLKQFGIDGQRIAKWPGVWVPAGRSGRPEKIAALGVHISRWQTSHGFALNVNTHLAHFDLIVPCGIDDGGVTSMERELGRAVDVGAVELELARSFGEVFGAQIEGAAPAMQTISTAVVKLEEGDPRVLLLHRVPSRGAFWQIVTGRLEPGESARDAAAREVFEETGQHLELIPLDYRHSFAWGDDLPPRVVQETAFAASWKDAAPVQLNPMEHDGCSWLGVEDALATLPFTGLRRAVQLAMARRLSGPR